MYTSVSGPHCTGVNIYVSVYCSLLIPLLMWMKCSINTEKQNISYGLQKYSTGSDDITEFPLSFLSIISFLLKSQIFITDFKVIISNKMKIITVKSGSLDISTLVHKNQKMKIQNE